MLRKVATTAAVTLAAIVLIFLVAGRRLSEATGYAQATADTAIDEITDQLPTEVRNRKLEQDLKVARQELIDRQVSLNVSRGQLERLNDDISRLEASVDRRARLLAEAYPVLKDAVDGNKAAIQFASTDYAMPDFQKEIDDLMTMQDRETRQLEIKRDGLARMEKSVHEGEQALADMRDALETTEQEIAVLKSRRDQARAEAATLDLISSVTADGGTSTSVIGENVERLSSEVEQLEARNQARRNLAPVTDRQPRNQLTRNWSRLEELKRYHDANQPEVKPAADQPALADVAAQDGDK